MECLKMPARTFFIMLKTGRELKSEETSYFLKDLCRVAVCGNVSDMKYVDDLQDFFIQRTKPPEETKIGVTGPVFKADDPEAGRILIDLAKQKMRLEGHGGH